MTDVVVEQELTGTREGLTQLQRRWRPPGTTRSAVLVVHGVGEHSGRYDHVGRFLAARGHDVLSFDNRGHGQSGGKRGHVDRFVHFLDDVEDLVVERRQLGVPVVLLGHSLGGLIAATYVVRGRPQPSLLVLSSPALGVVTARWRRLLAPILSRVAPSVLVRNDIDGSVLSSDPAVAEAYERDPLRVKGSTGRFGHEVLTTMDETGAALDRLSVPTYVLHGSADTLVPAEHSQPLADLPNVTYRLWPGLRHECFNEPNGGDVLGELVDWIEARLG
ncbi:MAG: alpha/beta hydrolase [Acidimicrobiales bacterium]